MRPPTYNAFVLGNLREYRNKWYSAKIRFFRLHFCRKKYMCIFNILRIAFQKLPNSVK